MQQRIIHGAIIDILTPDELVHLLPRPPRQTRMRPTADVILDATGAGQVDVYKIPMGAEFDLRRVQFELSTVTGGNLGTAGISLVTVGNFCRYTRSGTPVGWALPVNSLGTGNGRIPGVETWGAEQGPYLRGGEVFGVSIAGGAANAGNTITITAEGILHENRVGA